MRATVLPLLVTLLLAMQLGAGPEQSAVEEGPAQPWFTNVARDVGLGGVRAKDCIFADLDGDGFHDICLDRERLYLSRAGERFTPHEDAGIAYPVIHRVPLDASGKPNEAKAKDGPYVPHYLYFADLDNDGHLDAVAGVRAWWHHYDGHAFRDVQAADPGVRSTVWLGAGGGRFKKAQDSAFTARDAVGPAMALAILDYDCDGRLDLYEGREYRQYGVLDGCGVDRLWRGGGAGDFVDVTRQAGLETVPEAGRKNSSRPSYGVTHADWNGDGWQDLLQLAYGRQWNYLWKNNGDGTFRDVGRKTMFAGDEITHGKYPDWLQAFMAERGRPPRDDEQPFRSNGNTFDCAVGDVDNDGDLDCFLGEICHEWAGASSDLPSLLVNQGAEKDWVFVRRTVRSFLPPRTFRGGQRWNYGDLHAAFLDVDNDGRLDLLIGSGDYPDGQYLRLYRQQADGGFEEVTEAAGFHWEGCGGLSIGDYDRDGDVDILAGRSFMRLSKAHRDKHMGGIEVPAVALFRNDIANRTGNHWLNVRLRGRASGKEGSGGSNRSGIGARILVTAGGVTQMRELRGGSGLANHQDPPEACFGLGKATRIDRLEVRWPNAKHAVQVFENVAVDQFVLVEEGSQRLGRSTR